MNSIFNPGYFSKILFNFEQNISNTCANYRFIKYLIYEGISGSRKSLSSFFKNSYPSNHFPRPFIVWLRKIFSYSIFLLLCKRLLRPIKLILNLNQWFSNNAVVVKKIMIQRGFLFVSNIIILSYFIQKKESYFFFLLLLLLFYIYWFFWSKNIQRLKNSLPQSKYLNLI